MEPPVRNNYQLLSRQRLTQTDGYNRQISEFLLTDLSNVFTIPFDGALTRQPVSNILSASTHPCHVGRVAGPFTSKPIAHSHVSPKNVVPKNLDNTGSFAIFLFQMGLQSKTLFLVTNVPSTTIPWMMRKHW
ncbi:hypothetical protein MAR_027824 [Mya arenaria]|uniref:Uncharacterized protein n=1 Tax=Mya arenaria TaxID=6604 RepID=A0ABY7EXG5_MYAAR|nr:hypothetical protein MAR_027824 [Mya arenaria]